VSGGVFVGLFDGAVVMGRQKVEIFILRVQ